MTDRKLETYGLTVAEYALVAEQLHKEHDHEEFIGVPIFVPAGDHADMVMIAIKSLIGSDLPPAPIVKGSYYLADRSLPDGAGPVVVVFQARGEFTKDPSKFQEWIRSLVFRRLREIGKVAGEIHASRSQPATAGSSS